MSNLSTGIEGQSKNHGQMTPKVHFTALLSISLKVVEDRVGRKRGEEGVATAKGTEKDVSMEI